MIPVEEEDKLDGVALALEEAVLVTSITDWEVGEPACVGVASIAEGVDGTLWIVGGVDDVDWVLVGEIEEEEDVDEEVKLVVAVVDKTGLTSTVDVVVAEDEGVEEDIEDTGVLSAVVAVVADGVAAAVIAVEGLAPAPMTGWGLVKPPGWEPVKSPFWGIDTRFLRKRLWPTW